MTEPIIHSVSNALQVMDLIIEEGGVSVKHTAERLGLDRSNAYRLLKTMEREGYLEFENRQYTMGYKLDMLSGIGMSPVQMRIIAEPIMRDVAKETEEIVYLCMRSRSGMMFVHQEFSQRIIQVVKKDGAIEPFYCTASGRSVLAYLPERYQETLLEEAQIKKYTEYTTTDIDKLRAILRTVKERGYAEEIEEFNKGVRCIGVPVPNSRGWPYYSIGVSFTTQSYSEQRRNRWVGSLKVGARQIAEACAGVSDTDKTHETLRKK